MALVLWCWALFLILNGHHLGFFLKCLAATKAKNKNLMPVLKGAANACSTN
jgi:hypothetical protein